MYQDLSAWVLATIERNSALGWGVDSDVMVARRSGWLAARAHATAPPQSWPTTWNRSAPAASASASTSPVTRAIV